MPKVDENFAQCENCHYIGLCKDSDTDEVSECPCGKYFCVQWVRIDQCFVLHAQECQKQNKPNKRKKELK